MWLSDLLPPKAEIRPTRPTSENHVGRHETLVTVAPSDTSDTSDMKNDMESSPEEKRAEQRQFAQVLYKNPESVRHDENALSRNGKSENPVGRSYGEKPFSVAGEAESDPPTPEQLAHARRMLVVCPSSGEKVHCWHCSRCSEARTCSAWHPRRADVAFFHHSEKPYSLTLAESGAVEVTQ